MSDTTTTQHILNTDYLSDAIADRLRQEARDFAEAAMKKHYPKMVELVVASKPGDVIRYQAFDRDQDLGRVGWQFVCKTGDNAWWHNNAGKAMTDQCVVRVLTERRAQGKAKIKRMS